MSKNKVYKAAMYLRISYTDDKSKQSESPINQRKIIEDFVKNNPDIEIVSEHLDDGVTGLVYDRPAFNDMMSEVLEEKINCFLQMEEIKTTPRLLNFLYVKSWVLL